MFFFFFAAVLGAQSSVFNPQLAQIWVRNQHACPFPSTLLRILPLVFVYVYLHVLHPREIPFFRFKSVAPLGDRGCVLLSHIVFDSAYQG